MKSLRLALMATAFAAVAVSCNKVKSTAKKVEGTWNVTSYTVNGSQQITPSRTGTAIFDACGATAIGEECTGSFNLNDAGVSNIQDFTFTYTISDDGRLIRVTQTVGTGGWGAIDLNGDWSGKNSVDLTGTLADSASTPIAITLERQ